jgi:cardiolipin synthase
MFQNHPKIIKKVSLSWRKAMKFLLPLGGVSFGNTVKIFHKSDDAIEAMLDAIEQAKTSIYLETYIFSADKIGQKFRDALVKAANRNVKVTVLYDHVGSARLPKTFFAPLRAARGEVLVFNPIWVWRRRGPLLFRDHRKILVIDEACAFCGSANIGEDYAGDLHGGRSYYHDSVALVQGPAAKDLLEITLESIAETQLLPAPPINDEYAIHLRQLSVKWFIKNRFFVRHQTFFAAHQGVMVQVLRSNTRRNILHIQKSMEECLERAVSHCYLTTPYFLPSQSLQKSIIDAQLRGVDVRILTSGLPDVPLMSSASRHVYRKFLEAGIRIYEMNGTNLHAKNATIDDIYGSVGSYNLDHWSGRRNLEVTLSVFDNKIADELKNQFIQDLQMAQEVCPAKFMTRSWLTRLICWLAYHIIRL